MNDGNDDIAHKLAAVHKRTEFIAVYLKTRETERERGREGKKEEAKKATKAKRYNMYFYGLGTNNHHPTAIAASFFFSSSVI